MSEATSQDPSRENRRRHKRVAASMPCVLVADDGAEESFVCAPDGTILASTNDADDGFVFLDLAVTVKG